MTMMNQTYDEWKSTEPDDPYADELELERREQEMEPDEPKYDPNWPNQDDPHYQDADELDWSDLNDSDSGINIITGEMEEQ